MSKRFTVLTLVLALAISIPVAAGETAADKAPRVTLVDPVKDFGTVPKGEKLDWSFVIKNTGTSDLEILSVKPACGCTVADFDKVIKPGETGKVTAHVDTTNFNGPISKSVAVETNDPSVPNAQLTISAIVKPYVEAFPAGFVRFNLLQGDTEKQSVLIYSEEQEPFEILKVETPQEWIRADIRKAEGADLMKVGREGQNQYVLDVTLGGPDARIGPIAEKVRVLTNSKHQPEYLLSVSGLIRPAFRVEPTEVNFGEVAPEEAAATRTVKLRSNNTRTPETFVVSKAESGIVGVTADVKPTANKGEYELTLQVTKDAPAGALDGTVLVHTSDSGTPLVKVPVKATVKSMAASSGTK
jgi:hypothetical protein